MATGLLPNLDAQKALSDPLPLSELSALPPEQLSYLSRIATLPAPEGPAPRSADRIDQIEHALTILASVVARLAKEAHQSKLQLRSSEQDPNWQEERRVQRELVRSMQSRLVSLEERLERPNSESVHQPLALQPLALQPPALQQEVAEQVAASLTSIRNALAALAKRRQAQK